MIDTHTHLYLPEYEGGAVAATKRAVDAGVSHLILPGVRLGDVDAMLDLVAECPESVSVALGLHPTELGSDWDKELNDIIAAMKGVNIVAIGETGIDYHWDSSNPEDQKAAFMCQLQMAAKWELPVIIHSRDALDDTLKVISDFKVWLEKENITRKEDKKFEVPKLIFHSFTGSPADVRKIRTVCDPWFGINGVVTFKNARELPEAVKEIGIEKILLETDSPYLAPVPFRGKRNESAYLPEILKKIASILEVPIKECESITDKNARHVFSNSAIVN